MISQPVAKSGSVFIPAVWSEQSIYDIVPDMTTLAFIQSLKCFPAHQRLPKKFASNNGKSFKAAAQAIKTIMNSEEVQHYLAGVGVEWVFNVERAPWWGGWL